jgi:hypothetical protein
MNIIKQPPVLPWTIRDPKFPETRCLGYRLKVEADRGKRGHFWIVEKDRFVSPHGWSDTMLAAQLAAEDALGEMLMADRDAIDALLNRKTVWPDPESPKK